MLIIGVFSPVLNWCGGAEWVAINIINALKNQGHQIIVLTDKPLNQDKFEKVFNRRISIDRQIVFPFRLFPSTDFHNIYTDAIRSLMLKIKCEVLIDPYSNAILPGMDVSYVQVLLLKQLSVNLRSKIYFYPYAAFLNSFKKTNSSKLVFANSKFTAETVKSVTDINPIVLYPPVSSAIVDHDNTATYQQRDNNVITVARICKEKNLNVIPKIARLTRKEVSFIIAGLLDSEEVLNSLYTLIKKFNVSERVKILTNIKRDHLNRLLTCAKVFLHPSINEPFGVSIVEAMSAGCIPIVHNSGGPTEFVPTELRYKTVEEAAEKVEKNVDNWSPEQAYKISQISEKFNETNFSKRFIDIFNSHLSKAA